jgi:hypothetical protein
MAGHLSQFALGVKCVYDAAMPDDIHPHGYWLDVGPHSACHSHWFDRPLADRLLHIITPGSSVWDMGCGDGRYVKFLNDHSRHAVGIDGNPNAEYIHSCMGDADLADVLCLPNRDWVLSLEVGEHIPKGPGGIWEQNYIYNLHRSNRHGIILSWAIPIPGQGHGHVNEQPNSYVREKICALGYTNDPAEDNDVRKCAEKDWFRNSVMIFRRIK